MSKYDFITREWLIEQHYILKKTLLDISIEFNCSATTIKSKLKKYDLLMMRHTEEAKEKRKNTNLKKYGVEFVTRLANIQKKIIATNIKRYGVERPSKCKKTKDKIIKTCLKKYGVTSTNKLNTVKEKKKQTCLEKYGVEYYTQTKNYRQTNSGSDNCSRKHFNETTKNLIENSNWLYNEHINNKKPHNLISKELGVSPSCVDRVCKKFGIVTQTHSIFCSLPEKELSEHIKSIYTGEVIQNSRTIIPPKELDIYIPDKNLAIEYDGLFWHSYDKIETESEKNKHIDKTISCEEKEIQLLHIFENEWLYKNDIVKSIINSKLGIYGRSIFARKCEVKELTLQETNQFLIVNHLQGYVYSKINIGLIYENELVSLMTFGIPRYNKLYKFELLRYCCSLNTKVSGGASKILSYFIKKYSPESLISYADRRYSNGKLYKSLGFNLSHSTKPNYFYYKNRESILFSRIKFQKHKLHKLLENFEPELTEPQNMFNNDYRRIWDCGNLVFDKLF